MTFIRLLFLLIALAAADPVTAQNGTITTGEGASAATQAETDAAIATRIRDILHELDGYGDVTVTVKAGIVTLRGTTLDPVRPNHHIRILLNDVELGDFYFNATEVYIFEAEFSALKEGENQLVIQSVGDTGAQIDQIYLDWIELEYPRQFIAEQDLLEFFIPNQDGNVGQFKIWNISDPNVHIFDLTHNSFIEDVSVNSPYHL